jgi:cell division septum initiation protein DivIVA
MAIVKRVDIEAVLGVPFTSLYEVREMSELLDQGLKNIAQSAPELHQDLQIESKELKALIVTEQQIQSQSQKIQTLEGQLTEAEETLKKASIVYDQGSMTTIATMGATPGPAPTSPGASAFLTPLITSITAAQQLIQELKSKIKELRQQIAEKTIEFIDSSEKVANSVIDKVSSYQSKSYNTDEEKFISK